MILRAKWVVDRTMKVHKNGQVDTELGTRNSEQAVDLGDVVLMPGLVNAHGHLDYTEMRGLIPPPKNFTSWIESITQLKRSWTEEDYVRSIERGMAESLAFGTTTMANWVCSQKLAGKVAVCPIRIWWFWEQIAFRSKTLPAFARKKVKQKKEAITFGDGASLETWEGWESEASARYRLWKSGLAPHAPYTCRSEVIQEATRWSALHRRPWSIHIAESHEEFEMFRHAHGSLYDMFKRLGRDMSDCGRDTPLGNLRFEISNLRSPVLLVHANQLDLSDFELLEESISRAPSLISMIHCPRSHHYFGHPKFPLTRLRDAKVNLCLGTDSLASNKDLSMFREMNLVAQNWPELDPRVIVLMATINGVRALGMEKEWLNWQDWIAIPAQLSRSVDVWSAITHFTGDPCFVMINEQVLRHENTSY